MPRDPFLCPTARPFNAGLIILTRQPNGLIPDLILARQPIPITPHRVTLITTDTATVTAIINQNHGRGSLIADRLKRKHPPITQRRRDGRRRWPNTAQHVADVGLMQLGILTPSRNGPRLLGGFSEQFDKLFCVHGPERYGEIISRQP